MNTFKAGDWFNQGRYQCFIPNSINRDWVFERDIMEKAMQATYLVGKLDMASFQMPNVNLFIQMHVAKEAAQSSRIEGTKTNVEEVMMEEQTVAAERRDDWQEVQNYIAALNFAISRLDELPISTRLIQMSHRLLMQGVRGEHKHPGEYRRSQNWIGGGNISNASFVPPPHIEVHSCMGDLEKFLHNDDIFMPEVLRVAIMHYQFETIHPFLDGNGRIGRLLILLCLIDKGLLQRPTLYISDYLERNRSTYYKLLTQVREENNIKKWCHFMLDGIIETCNKGIQTLKDVLELKDLTSEKIRSLGTRAGKGEALMLELYQRPITNAQQVAQITGTSLPSAYKLINDLDELGILDEITGNKRSKVYRFTEYIQLFS